MSRKKPENRLSVHEAKKALQDDLQKREAECAEAMKKLLAKHNCTLAAIPVMRPDGTLGARPIIKALPDKE